MSEFTDLSMIQLEQAVRQAAIPAEQQIAKLKGWDVTYEIGSDFENWCRWALNGKDAPKLTDEQRSRLLALDKWFDEMPNWPAGWGTEDALRTRPEWEEVRRQARGILEAFGWSIDE